ncbi:phospholipase A2 [Xylaria sp. FL0064]|nr:phospholipase A2 [Xylaria sp. FL0064]
MTSILSKLSPIPRFPEFTGPYKVGTVDVEIPVCELESPAPAPENAAEIETIQFRIFYPCDANATGKRISWLPAPQRDYVSAYIKFLGLNALLAEAASFIPRHLHYTTIPVAENAPILKAETPNGRWPTMIFSHGLGGSRNAYSQISGSLASHGVVVFCPEHRDGSAIASLIRVPYQQQNRFFARNTKRMVPYVKIPHDSTDEVHELRNGQLQIRLWELGLLYEAILSIDDGAKVLNLSKNTPVLDHFSNQLHVHDPGSLIFAGHSFGAATIVQFFKSVFYAGRPELEAMETLLYTPNWESSICRQITQQNVTILLDMWCFPLTARTTKPLFNLPLPVYAPSDSSSSPSKPPGGNAILAVESEDFFKWRDHLHVTARILSPDPSAQVVAPPIDTAMPHFFYVKRSSHVNQSDFALLFPWLTRKVLGSAAPGRALRLNLRAILQVLRVNNIAVAGTQSVDMVDNTAKDAKANPRGAGKEICTDDKAILEHEGNAIRENEETVTTADDLVQAWKWINIVGMGEGDEMLCQGQPGKKKKKGDKEKDDKDKKDEGEEDEEEEEEAIEGADKTDAHMAGVIEPSDSLSIDRKMDFDTASIFSPAERQLTAQSAYQASLSNAVFYP